MHIHKYYRQVVHVGILYNLSLDLTVYAIHILIKIEPVDKRKTQKRPRKEIKQWLSVVLSK